MNCPHCNIPLLMTDRKGVEIDYCSQCRGIWLDRGELDKIIDLSVGERFNTSTHYAQDKSTNRYAQDRDSGYRDPAYNKRYSKHHKPYYKYKKKKTLLGEIFDIF